MSVDKTSYEWLFFKRRLSWLRRGPFCMGLYRGFVNQENEARPGFTDRLRHLALAILKTEDDMLYVRQAICALAVVGTEEDIPVIQGLDVQGNMELVVDVKTCIYEIKHR